MRSRQLWSRSLTQPVERKTARCPVIVSAARRTTLPAITDSMFSTPMDRTRRGPISLISGQLREGCLLQQRRTRRRHDQADQQKWLRTCPPHWVVDQRLVLRAHIAIIDAYKALSLHRPNVWIDLSDWSSKYLAQLVQYVNKLLRDRVLFGCGYLLITIERRLKDLTDAGFKPAVHEPVVKSMRFGR